MEPEFTAYGRADGEGGGTATAAGLCATGALAAAIGYGLYDIAILLSLATFATLLWTRWFKTATHDPIETTT